MVCGKWVGHGFILARPSVGSYAPLTRYTVPSLHLSSSCNHAAATANIDPSMLVPPSSKSRGFRTQAAGCQTRLEATLQDASLWASLLLLLSISALAQSAGTLEAIRGARSDALERAEGDLTSCIAVSCLHVNRLSLLVGYL